MDRPEDLVQVPTCALSGMKASEACPSHITEWLPSHSLPPVCCWHVLEGGVPGTLWPAEYATWARAAGRPGAAGPGPGPATPAAERRVLLIENPPEGATYWIDPTLRAEFQALDLRARGEQPGTRIAWTMDGRPLGIRPASSGLRWVMTPGRHVVVARDMTGRTATCTFVAH